MWVEMEDSESKIKTRDECEHEKWLNYWKDVYDDWLNVNLWEINEATCLLCGLNPDGLHNSNYPSGSYFSACWYDEQRRAGDSDFKNRFKRMNRLILDGVEARELIRDATTYKLHKLTIVKWAIAKIGSNKLPKPLVEWYEQQPKQPTEQSNNSFEWNDDNQQISEDLEKSYLKIIGVLLAVINGTALPKNEKQNVSVKQHPSFASQADLVTFIAENETYKKARGLGKTSLDTKFANAKKTLNESLK